MNVQTAVTHLEEAIRLLTGEVWRGPDPEHMEKVDGMCVTVMDLERIDRALGPKGESMFARMADQIQSAYVEIKAARAALAPSGEGE